MAKPTAQQCHALTTYYISQYREVVGSTPVLNRNKCRYGFEGLLMDFTPTEARDLVDYYLAYYDKPNVEWFLYNYEKVVQDREERKQREETTAKRREVTAQRLAEWRERWKPKES